MKYKQITVTEKTVNEKDHSIIHYISTPHPDRSGEVMNPNGCDFSEYKKNPVVFFSHRSRDLPIGKNEFLEVSEKGIIAKTVFDSSDFAKEIFRLNAEGFLNSWSIGYSYSEPPVLKDGIFFVDKWNLLEYSSVPIPANPECINLLIKSLPDYGIIPDIEWIKKITLEEISKFEDRLVKKLKKLL
ncbi:MAG TPA: HK97 family phage prohead protease [Ignavibacteria bacterium]|nr:HK97 family phage prohead protease [Ignavibacteria bacterium]